MTTIRPPSASTGKHRTPAAWVSGASARYAGRPAERVAHQRQRGHRLEVAGGQHHALGQPGRAARADQHREVVGRVGLLDRVLLLQPASRRSLIEADRGPQHRKLSAIDHRRRSAGDRCRHSQSNSSSSARFSAASLRGLIGHQTAPRRAIPNTHANACASLDERIPTLLAGPDARRGRARRRRAS